MTASRQDIVGWIRKAQQCKATHLIVAVDRFDHDNYPVYIMPGEDVNAIITAKYSGQNMQGFDEVYSFTGKYTIESQLAERRAVHFD